MKTLLPTALMQLACILLTSPATAGSASISEQIQLARSSEHRPMIFFVAEGPNGSCGPGCHEWIAAIGQIDEAAGKRFRNFTKKLSGRNLPVFFHSPGGNGKAGVEIGSILRERRMTAGVGRTEAKCKVFTSKDTHCQSRINSGDSISATLATREGQCLSACVYAFVGASTRQVAAGAAIGVHAPRMRKVPAQKLKTIAIEARTTQRTTVMSEFQQFMRRYYLSMGVDPALEDLAAKTPNSKIYILDRRELTRLGLETKADGHETPWVAFTTAGKERIFLKSATRRTTSEPAEYLTWRFQISCSAVVGRAVLSYRRELTSKPDQVASRLRLTFGDQSSWFRSKPDGSASEIGFSLIDDLRNNERFEKLTAAKALSVIEIVDVSEASEARETKLSTAGLAPILEDFRKQCFADPPPAIPEPHRLRPVPDMTPGSVSG